MIYFISLRVDFTKIVTMSQISKNSSAKGQVLHWQIALQRLEGAYADSTLRAYKADIKTFVSWCQLKNRHPFPAAPRLIVDYISDESESYSASTIRRRLAAISKIHRLMKLKNSVADEDVKLALRRQLRKKSTRQKQALGMTREIRDMLIGACDNSLTGKRDKTIIALGYDTLARRSEIASITIEDVTIGSKSTKVIIRRSKNDQFGVGRVSYVSPKALKMLKDWLKAARITEGPLFRGIKHNTVQACALHPHSIGRIVKLAAERAGLSQNEVQKLSGHSMRIGAAQDMMAAGFDILPIMAAGGWKTTNVVARYIENADISPMLRSFYR
jgi:integrase/recombinase XerD